MAEFKEVPANAPVALQVTNWFENRFPTAFAAYRVHMSEYYAPKNFNFWYIFGSLALLVLVIQIVTGIFLVMHYKPDAALAFASVEYIMRDVPWGWLVRYMHSTGASAFFVVVYLHMFRGLLYGSYRKPRELVWIFGCAIFLALMGEAFMGYLLPWGQMSYWGAQVIVNLFAAIPFVGPDLALLIRGDYVVSDATLNRFFSFHVIAIPLVLLGLVVAHLLALHDVGSNNPDGVEIKAKKDPKTGIPLDGIPFHPYYSVHDVFGVGVFLLAFSAIIFFAPELGGYFLEYNNFIPADPLKTPAHIAPVWYFTPYYSMLRAITGEMAAVLALIVLLAAFLSMRRLGSIAKLVVLGGAVAVALALGLLPALSNWFGPLAAVVTPLTKALPLLTGIDAKFWGVVVMGGAVVILFFLPWLDFSPVKSIRYRPSWHKYVYGIFVINFLILGYLGVQPPSPIGERVSQVGTLFYFGFFLLMPWWSRIGEFKPVPDRVTFAAH
jgi:ubiquinol-cytochrome c reductase cytochrome b subunit